MDTAGREGERHVRTTRFARTAVAALFLLLLPVGAVGLPAERAGAQSGVHVLVVAPDDRYGVGEEIPFFVRVEGAGDLSLDLSYRVDGGALVGALAPNQVGPGIHEAVAYVRADRAGPVTLTVDAGGNSASASVEAVLAGRIAVELVVEGAEAGGSRTWPVAIVSGGGATVATLIVAGDADGPGRAVTPLLPYGSYRVQQLLGPDTSSRCADGAAFAVESPPSGEATVELRGPRAEVRFVVRVCAQAAGPTPTPVEAVAGEQVPGPASAPTPPATGSAGLATEEPGASGFDGPFVLAAVAAALWAGAVATFSWRRAHRRSAHR